MGNGQRGLAYLAGVSDEGNIHRLSRYGRLLEGGGDQFRRAWMGSYDDGERWKGFERHRVMSMMKSEEASSMDDDMHATRRERNSKSGTLGDWGIQEARPWPTRAASHDLAGFWTTRMSRFDSGPYRSSGFNSRLASSFVPRLSGAESGCSRISTSISSCSPHARGKRKRRPISSEKIERRAIRRTQEYVRTQSYAIENAIEMIRFLQKPLEFGRLLIK
jgi:hypothetical protein